VIYKSTLKPRHKELLILRIGWLCAAKYEWVHHVTIAKRIGISEEEIENIKKSSKSTIFNVFESSILKAADELYTNSIIEFDTWKELAKNLTKSQLVDFLFTAGEYTMVCWFLNSAGVNIEEGIEKMSIPTKKTIIKSIPSSFTPLKEPRISPLKEENWDEETSKLVNRWNEISKNPLPNVHRTIINNSKLFKRWRPFSNHILFKNSLSPRDREIVILRIGWLCQSRYELAQHVGAGIGLGFSDKDFQNIWNGPKSEGLASNEAALLSAVDELYLDAIIKDETWEILSRSYNQDQLLDIVFTTGQYNLISTFLNSIGVQFDTKELENLSPL
jgi:alkylhydroperoxidase family enzyme